VQGGESCHLPDKINKMKVYLVESGYWGRGAKDFTKIIADEEKALLYCFRRFGTRNFARDNPLKIPNLRARWIGKKRWAILTEHKVLYFSKKKAK